MRFGGITVLDSASFDVERGQICGLIGPNGAGKTTLFNCITRIYQPTSGSITFDDVDLLKVRRHAITSTGIARTFQNLGLFPTQTVLENVLLGAHRRTSANFATSVITTRRVRNEEKQQRDEGLELLERLGHRRLAAARPARRAGQRPDPLRGERAR
ncbi:MAG: Branched-chain amino acid transport ATP-binding protein LivG [uncultured Acidimicrobiales bacterium]|uniref:Branched-chain amino acid transport ATP-binding protein LivG n=1 Tax=uncultured Acidimicrobiales bacterium TaxID=310071 RepID=A0A6J4H5F7_9ACTN|nr:MAG: Branched-chain amino acid transport ATP-binding protein LivG [uncultured Acidimicrobiales bacterium]